MARDANESKSGFVDHFQVSGNGDGLPVPNLSGDGEKFSDSLDDDKAEPEDPARRIHAGMTKAEFLQVWRASKTRVATVEREVVTLLRSFRPHSLADFQDLELAQGQIDETRVYDQHQLVLRIAKTRAAVSHFQAALARLTAGPKVVETLRATMEQVESAITTTKIQQRHVYDDLARSEHLTLRDVQAYERKFDAWETMAEDGKCTTALPKRVRPSRLANPPGTGDAPDEVAAFDMYLAATGGHRGGWDEYDHSTFLKHRGQHGGRSTFIPITASLLVGRTETDVRLHEAWYQEYQRLRAQRRAAIHGWRVKQLAAREAEAGAQAVVQAANEERTQAEQRNGAERAQRRLAEERAKLQVGIGWMLPGGWGG